MIPNASGKRDAASKLYRYYTCGQAHQEGGPCPVWPSAAANRCRTISPAVADSRGRRIPQAGLAASAARTITIVINALLSRITIEPGKCDGRPCIRGYRLRVKDGLELLAHGASWKEILRDYSFLEADDSRACLEYAAAQNEDAVLRAS